MSSPTFEEVRRLASNADSKELAALERALAHDARKGVAVALERARRRISSQDAEDARLSGIYAFERDLAESRNAKVVVGVDEVGRGCLAGPLAVGAAVLPSRPLIEGLDDSKHVSPARREAISETIRREAVAFAVCYIEPAYIDDHGMADSLRKAFSEVVCMIAQKGVNPDIVLLDGKPLHFDRREVNVIRGDSKCASIAAASILAKVERDHLMAEADRIYPGYGFSSNKGYGTEEHRSAIARLGITSFHRKSFCSGLLQESLF